MEAPNPLSELADIHLPGAISWWPPAFGWWLLVTVLLSIMVWFCIQWYQHRQRLQAMKSAIVELDSAWQDYRSSLAATASTSTVTQGEAGVVLLNGINSVLRRVVIQKYPDTDIASLHGDNWLAFLDSCDGSSHFSARAGKVLGEASYCRSWDEDPAPVFKLAKAWIHRRYLLDKAQTARPSQSAASAGQEVSS